MQGSTRRSSDRAGDEKSDEAIRVDLTQNVGSGC
jgi:hypothetical protein